MRIIPYANRRVVGSNRLQKYVTEEKQEEKPVVIIGGVARIGQEPSEEPEKKPIPLPSRTARPCRRHPYRREGPTLRYRSRGG